MILKFVYLLLLVSLASGFQQREIKSSVGQVPSKQTSNDQIQKRLDSPNLSEKDKILKPSESENANEDNGLIEVKEEEIPEGSLVYVVEEPEERSVDGEILKTADNIVFRPLFRYRAKQEAQRRNSNRIRRRYFIPKRSYRQAYRTILYPLYYNYRYY